MTELFARLLDDRSFDHSTPHVHAPRWHPMALAMANDAMAHDAMLMTSRLTSTNRSKHTQMSARESLIVHNRVAPGCLQNGPHTMQNACCYMLDLSHF